MTAPTYQEGRERVRVALESAAVFADQLEATNVSATLRALLDSGFLSAAMEYCRANRECDEYLSSEDTEAGAKFAERIEAFQESCRSLEDAYRRLTEPQQKGEEA